jgi:hypothetical protein
MSSLHPALGDLIPLFLAIPFQTTVATNHRRTAARTMPYPALSASVRCERLPAPDHLSILLSVPTPKERSVWIVLSVVMSIIV